jgi:hypothetical protein
MSNSSGRRAIALSEVKLGFQITSCKSLEIARYVLLEVVSCCEPGAIPAGGNLLRERGPPHRSVAGSSLFMNHNIARLCAATTITVTVGFRSICFELAAR